MPAFAYQKEVEQKLPDLSRAGNDFYFASQPSIPETD
jgi:hypothetical protein